MIMTFDLATNTGWCAGAGADYPHVGYVTMPSVGDNIGAMGVFFRKWLQVHLADWKPTAVVFESPILPVTTTPQTTRKLQGLAWELETTCALLGIPCTEVAGSTIKKYLTGNGRAQKPDMLRWARKCGVEASTHDEADAFAIWIWSLQYLAAEHVRQWDDRRFKDQLL